MVGISDTVVDLLAVKEARSRVWETRGIGVTKADTGRVVRAFLAGDSNVEGRVVVEAFFVSLGGTSEVLDALEIESRILWNFRLVVLSATAILDEVDVLTNLGEFVER